jgi:hypothetical protein
MTFYQEFITFKNQVEEDPSKVSKIENFLNFFIKTEKNITYEHIIMLSDGLKNYIKKPQRVLYDKKDYYVAIDLNTNLHYICFRNIAMIDIDLHFHETKDQVLKDLILKLKEYNDTYYIDETLNGFHIYILNKYMNHNDKETIEYLLNFKCDIKYIICTYLRGFCVRLNKKDPYDPMYKFIEIFGKDANNDILNDVKNIKLLTNIYKDILVY